MPVPKGSGCHGCPFESGGAHMVPDEYVEGAQVEVMGQNPGDDEVAGRKLIGRPGSYEPHAPAPYLGATGYDMERAYFPKAGLERGRNVSLSNALRCRLNGANKLPPLATKDVRRAIEHCRHAYHRPPASTRLTVAEGEYALYACTGEDGSHSPGHKISRTLSGWRGWALPWNPPPRPQLIHSDVWTPRGDERVVLATYHLAFLYRSPEYTPCSFRDWSRVPHIVKGQWPMRMPALTSHAPEAWPRECAADTEFVPETGKLIRWSMAAEGSDGPLVYVVEADDTRPITSVGPRPHIVFHNLDADIGHFNEILAGAEIDYEDTMYADSVLNGDLDHDLDFLGSMHARTNRWKHLVHTNPRVYAGGDALGTWDVWQGLLRAFKTDPRSWHLYKNVLLPVAPTIIKAKQFGTRVDQARVRAALVDLHTQGDEASRMAQAAVGWPLNVGSVPQVSHHLYQIEKVHLNPLSGKQRTRGAAPAFP